MNFHFLVKSVVAVALASTSLLAFGASWQCFGLGEVDCNPAIMDLVTERFAMRFPGSNYDIVAIYSTLPNSTGQLGIVSFATITVAPRLTSSDQKKYGDIPLVSLKRWSATWFESGDVSQTRRQQIQRDTLRQAMKRMMDECNRTANCNILQ